jgi:hypothetical protein
LLGTCECCTEEDCKDKDSTCDEPSYVFLDLEIYFSHFKDLFFDVGLSTIASLKSKGDSGQSAMVVTLRVTIVCLGYMGAFELVPRGSVRCQRIAVSLSK